MSGPKMWPRVLPASVRSDRYRAAEVKVYDLLERSLSSEWTVYYSRPWLGLTPSGAERDGEADFILAIAREKLGRRTLSAPTIALDLRAAALMSCVPRASTSLPGSEYHAFDAQRLI